MSRLVVVRSVVGARRWVRERRAAGETVGFVPTMGALHAGHRSLIEVSVAAGDATVVSIFVNPAQFGPGEDFERYPRTFEADLSVCDEAGAQLVFHPTVNEMYPPGSRAVISVKGLDKLLCGRFRPGHFDGVATVVAKLFMAVPANRAYFGQKDAQQIVVIKQMVRDLCMDVEIVACPIMRDRDGVALSSRNAYLSDQERIAARCLVETLRAIEAAHRDGERRVRRLVEAGRSRLERESMALTEYLEIVDASDLKRIRTVDRPALAALAVRIGSCRLIDNVTLVPGPA